MAFSNQHDDDAPMADINVTPLVDVMLVLLIVFMITMPVLTHSLQIELPTTSQQADNKPKPKQETKPTIIQIDESGSYAFGADSQEHLNIDAVKQRLQEIKQNNPDAIVGISAHKEVPYDFVAKALDVVRETGFSKVGFVMQEESKSE